MFAIGDATGISPIHTTLDKQALGWLFVIGFLAKTIGTQWQGMAAADNSEVKRHLGLNPDGSSGPTQVENPNQTKLPFTLLLVLAVGLACGCARVSIIQTETDLEGYTRTTRFKATTFFDSKNELAKVRSTMTDKTQGVSISGLEQESSGSNAVNLAESVVRGAVRGAVEGAKSFP